MINQDKTEQYLINGTTHEWRKCKYLGRMLDTNEDTKLRKVFVVIAVDRIFTILYKFLYKNNFIQLVLFYL